MSASSPALSGPPPLSRPAVNPWIIAITVTLATFMEVLDTSIANVALPHIAGNLSATVDESTWVLTSYLVSNAIILPLSGWLSSLFGRKRFYMTCVAVFTISSMLCGLAPNLATLVVFRILQGLGGGGLQPSEQAILMDTFPREKRGMGMAVYGIAVVVAPILGPTLGGWITDNYSWRWIFLINLPVGILSMVLTSQLVFDPPHLKRRHGASRWRIDYIGLGLIALGIGALQIVLDKGEREDWFQSRFIVILAVVSIAAIAIAIIWELRHKDPLVDLHLMKDPNFAISTLLMFMLGFVLFGSTMLLPLFMQILMGYSATIAGEVVSPGGIVTLFMMPVAGFLLGKFQPKWLIICGLAIVAYGVWRMSLFTLQIDYMTAAKARMVQGLGLAFLFPPINVAAYAFLPKEKNNNASGIINLARNIGGSFGIALVTTLLARSAQIHRAYMVQHLTPYDPAFRDTLAAITRRLIETGADPVTAAHKAQALIGGALHQQATVMAYSDAFRFLAIAFVAMIPLVFLMKKPPKHVHGDVMAH